MKIKRILLAALCLDLLMTFNKVPTRDNPGGDTDFKDYPVYDFKVEARHIAHGPGRK